MQPAITADRLSKCYKMHPQTSAYAAAVGGLRRLAKYAVGRGARSKSDADLLWALRDVTFSVEPGEVVGIIGRNGAGKSTLLKVLSRITDPTSGWAELRGRVGSLLEVGTGFNPELTGRENVYLSAAILGMRQDEIDQRFESIVEFADVPGFIDTPVKHYSSGMYMRLAFAVAAHLRHEIMFIDEVLAVGDAAFQKKCLGRLNEEARSGRTILFVSHAMPAIVSLCSRALWFDRGKLVMDGSPAEVVQAYEESFENTRDVANGMVLLENVDRYGSGKAKFSGLRIAPVGPKGEERGLMRTGGDLLISVEVAARETIADTNVAVIIYDVTGYRIVDVNTGLHGRFLSLKEGETARIDFTLRDLLLKPGRYQIGLWLGRTNAEDTDGISRAAWLEVHTNYEGLGFSSVFPGIYQCRFDDVITQDVTSIETQRLEPMLPCEAERAGR
jgi:lipopolysaccharide transport system ATP-binding protein